MYPPVREEGTKEEGGTVDRVEGVMGSHSRRERWGMNGVGVNEGEMGRRRKRRCEVSEGWSRKKNN